MAVGRHVERLVVVQELEDVGGGRGVDDGGGDELVHGFVVGGVGGVVDEAGAAAVDGAGEEGHADGFLVGDSLEGADEVGAFEVLGRKFSGVSVWISTDDLFFLWGGGWGVGGERVVEDNMLLLTLDSCVHMSRSSSSMSMSPNGLRIPPIKPDLPTAFLTDSKPDPTTPFAPTMPATELVTFPTTL